MVMCFWMVMVTRVYEMEESKRPTEYEMNDALRAQKAALERRLKE